MIDHELLPYLVMPIGGSFIALMCWIFLFPKRESKEARREKMR